MLVKLRWFRSTRRPAALTAPPPRPAPRFRPFVEGFEDRVVPAAPAALSPALVAPAAAAPIAVVPINITNILNNNGVLSAVGQIGNNVVTALANLTLSPNSTATTPILDLHLGAIHLDVLGLTVDTSEICLEIDATSGQGNLLGNLLTGVAHLLDGGVDLGSILGGLSPGNLNALLGGLTGLLNGVLGQLTAPSAVAGVSGNILHLSLGPIDLNLLGLEVHLDDCDDGPVTVDVGAESGPGKLLGNLLGGLSHLLDSNANSHALNNAIGRVTNAINGLLNI
jgi:hypothetical protein